MNRSTLENEIKPIAADWTCVADLGTLIGEGPVYSVAERCLYLVDIPARRIHRHVEGHPIETFEVSEPVTSAVPRKGGGLLLTLERGIAFFDPATGLVQPVHDMGAEPVGNRFNDAKCDRRGRLWAGTMGKEAWSAPIGTLYRFGADLRPESMVGGIRCSNGLGWSPDNKTFYYTESFAHTIWAFDFDLDSGSISNRRIFSKLDPGAGAFPDGLAVDAEGGVWSAQPVYGRLVRYDHRGRIERIIDAPVSRPTSLAFGGADMATLYVTTALDSLSPRQIEEEPLAGALLSLRPGISGLPEVPFGG
jgi:sugar lactone lactonase YvrE